MVQIQLHIKGMHCPSCPILIEEALGSIPGILYVKAHLRSGTCDLEYDEMTISPEVLLDRVNEEIKPLKFTAFLEKEKMNLDLDFIKSKKYWLEMLGAGALAACIWFLMEQLGLIAGMSEAEGIFMPLSVGFAASLSSCLALTGSVIIAFASRLRFKGKGSLLVMNASLQAGRLTSFFVMGGVLGIIGGGLYISGNFMAFMYIAIGIFLILLGLSMLDMNLTRFVALPMPSSFSFIKRFMDDGSSTYKGPFIAGFLTFFLPCGFALSMMLVALQSHNFLSGGLTMLLFALGTLPVLFIVGLTASFSSRAGFGLLKKTMAFLVIAFALQTFSTASYLLGYEDNMLGLFSAKVAYAAEERPKQTIETTITSNAFVPRRVEVKAGHEVTWNITGDNVSRCTNRIIVPDLNINLPIKNGLNTVTFIAPDKPGTIKYSCWMAMVFGALQVVE